ncbi:MAG: glycosyltransferase family 2 protein [Candidatus Doudnabacteria bacterium]|nr:glycosyltransferase family 2 protein [Candidatus Doudnabacteria bacterium]
MKVSVIVVIYNSKKWIKLVFDAIFSQTYKNIEVIAVISANDDNGKEYLKENYPSVKILDPGKNLGFSAANNLAIRELSGDLIQMVNPDLILEPNFIEEILTVFDNPNVASATGKLLRFNFDTKQKTNIIDSTGIVMSNSGRARDRGQLELDQGQYDDKLEVFGVSGAGSIFRRTALEKVKYENEYFDEDFFMYWEDVDISWRLANLGYKAKYVPTAIAYHGRSAGQAEGGYLHVFKFIKHHKKLSPQILKWNYKNHVLMYIKNAKHLWYPTFWLREIAMLGYIIVFETGTLKIIPELFRQLPRIWKKRKWTYQ